MGAISMRDLAYKTSLWRQARTLSGRDKGTLLVSKELEISSWRPCCSAVKVFGLQATSFCGGRRLSMLDGIMKLNRFVVELVFALFYISGLVAQERPISLKVVYPEAASRDYSTVELRCGDIETLNEEQFPLVFMRNGSQINGDIVSITEQTEFSITFSFNQAQEGEFSCRTATDEVSTVEQLAGIYYEHMKLILFLHNLTLIATCSCLCPPLLFHNVLAYYIAPRQWVWGCLVYFTCGLRGEHLWHLCRSSSPIRGA